MKIEGTTIGITGVGGFIGYQMVQRALARGMKVKGMDFSPTAVQFVNDEAKRNPQAHNFLSAFVGDVNDPQAAARLCQDCDIVFHTAAILDVNSSFEASRRVNVQGTVNVAEAARSAKVRRFVHLSSVMVYGFTFPKYVAEDGPKRGENDPYCQTKIESEEAVMKFHDKPNAGMEVIVIRPGDVYGVRSQPWVLAPLVMMKRGILCLPDGGRGCMNHVHVDNLIDGIFLALENDEATGEAFNLTDGGNTTWIDYYSKLAEIGRVPKPTTLPYNQLIALMHLKHAYPNFDATPTAKAIDFLTRPHPYSIEKARTKLGYAPKIPLERGLEEIQHFLKDSKFGSRL